MNKITLLISFTTILALHFIIITKHNSSKTPINLSKPKYEKVSISFAQEEIPEPVIKTKKSMVKKKKEVKKVLKKIVKKQVQKKEKVKKQTVKKVEKKIVKRLVKKTPKKSIKPKLEKSNKATTQSLEKYKKHKEDYLTKLRAAIDENKSYPRLSKRLKEQGTVFISFTILKTGFFQDIKVLTSSGKKRLDKAALKSLQLTKNFEPFTKEIKKEFLNITIPIVFTLN